MEIAAPVANQIKVPDSMNSLGSLLNVASGVQQYKAQNLDLQKATQANQERVALQQFTSDPNNWQTNGKIDLGKINAAVPQIAPLTGGDYISHMTALNGAQTAAGQAQTNLTQSQRGIVSSTLGVLGRAGVQDPAVYSGELDNLGKQFPDNPDMQRLVGSYKDILNLTQPGDHLPKMAISASQSLMNPAEQQASLSPTASLTNVGGSVNETLTTPAVGGNPPSVTMTGRSQPNTLPPTTPTVDAVGTPGYLGNGGTVHSGLAPADQAAIPILTKERADINNAAKTVPEQHFNNQQIIKLADETNVGKGAEIWANLQGQNSFIHDNPWTGSADNFNRLGHFIALQSSNSAKAMGLDGSDAARNLAEQATASTGWTREAIKSTTKVNDAMASGLLAFNNGMEAAIKNANGNVLAKRDFQNAWANNFDPKVYQVFNARQAGDEAELTKLLGPPGSQQRAQAAKALGQKALRLHILSENGSLP